MDEDEDWQAGLWTERTRDQYRRVGDSALEAFRTHIDVVARCRGEDDEPRVDESAERLAAAFGHLARAQFDFSGTLAPFTDFDVEDEDQEDEEDEEELDEADHRYVSVLLRRDFLVRSDADLRAAGNAARAVLWPDDPPDDDVESTSVGEALYLLTHARGVESLDDAPGLSPLAGAVLFVGSGDRRPTAADPADPETASRGAFEVDGEILFSQSDEW